MDVSDSRNYRRIYKGLYEGGDFFSRNTGRVLCRYGDKFDFVTQALLNVSWLRSNAGRLSWLPDEDRGEFDLSDALLGCIDDLLERHYAMCDGQAGGGWLSNAIERLLLDGDVFEMSEDHVREWVTGIGDNDLARISETRRWFDLNAKALGVQQDAICDYYDAHLADLENPSDAAHLDMENTKAHITALENAQSKCAALLSGAVFGALLNEDTGEYASLDSSGTQLFSTTLNPRRMLNYLVSLYDCSEDNLMALNTSLTVAVTPNACDVRDVACRLVGDGTGEVVPVRDDVLSRWTLRNCFPHVTDFMPAFEACVARLTPEWRHRLVSTVAPIMAGADREGDVGKANRLMLAVFRDAAVDVRRMVADGMTADQVRDDLLSACWMPNGDTRHEVEAFVTDALALPDVPVRSVDSLELDQGHTDNEER